MLLQHATVSVGAAPHKKKIRIPVSLAVNLKPKIVLFDYFVLYVIMYSCANKYLTENVKRNKNGQAYLSVARTCTFDFEILFRSQK